MPSLPRIEPGSPACHYLLANHYGQIPNYTLLQILRQVLGDPGREKVQKQKYAFGGSLNQCKGPPMAIVVNRKNEIQGRYAKVRVKRDCRKPGLIAT
jgi:hypothetical protein